MNWQAAEQDVIKLQQALESADTAASVSSVLHAARRLAYQLANQPVVPAAPDLARPTAAKAELLRQHMRAGQLKCPEDAAPDLVALLQNWTDEVLTHAAVKACGSALQAVSEQGRAAEAEAKAMAARIQDSELRRDALQALVELMDALATLAASSASHGRQ